jgi:hypothetical protein
LSDGHVYKSDGLLSEENWGTTVQVHLCEVDSKIDGSRHFAIFLNDGYRKDVTLDDPPKFVDDTPKPVLKTLPDR